MNLRGRGQGGNGGFVATGAMGDTRRNGWSGSSALEYGSFMLGNRPFEEMVSFHTLEPRSGTLKCTALKLRHATTRSASIRRWRFIAQTGKGRRVDLDLFFC